MKLRHRLRRFTPSWWITRYWHNRALLDEYWDAHPEVEAIRHTTRATEGGVVESGGSPGRVLSQDPVAASQHTDR
jgi:hypothetical protein